MTDLHAIDNHETRRSDLRRKYLGLTPRQRDVVLAALAIGNSFSFDQLRLVAAGTKESVLTAAQRALEAELFCVTSDPDVITLGDGVRDALDGLVIPAKMRHLHAKLARAYKRDAAPANLTAQQLHLAGAHRLASRFDELAADEALRLNDLPGAAGSLEQALKTNIGTTAEDRLRLKLSNVVALVGHPDRAASLLLTQIPDVPSHAHADADSLLLLSRELWRAMLVNAAENTVLQLLRMSSVEPSLVAEARIFLAFVYSVSHDVARARPVLEKIVETSLGHRLLAQLRDVETILASKDGDIEKAIASRTAALAAASLAGAQAFHRASNNTKYHLGFITGLELKDEPIASRGGDLEKDLDRGRVVQTSLTAAELALLRGDVPRAVEALSQVATKGGVSGARHTSILHALSLATALLGDEDTSDMAGLDEASIAIVLSAREPMTVSAILAPECELLVRKGMLGKARELLRRALTAAVRADPPFRLELMAARIGTVTEIGAARNALRTSRSTRLDEVAQAALLLFDVIVAARSGLRGLRYRQMAARAAGIFETVRWRLLQAEALEYAGSARSAAAIYKSAGAATDLRRLGIRYNRKGDDESRPLTTRQRAICNLALRGNSNRDISRALGLTEKTVEHHLSAAYSRLGIRSRWQLADALHPLREPT
jgi:DNA-binding CsgD family transcriptional regulator